MDAKQLETLIEIARENPHVYATLMRYVKNGKNWRSDPDALFDCVVALASDVTRLNQIILECYQGKAVK